ncbi:hypothetical protein Tco_0115325 [Tanacetum coccineum]
MLQRDELQWVISQMVLQTNQDKKSSAKAEFRRTNIQPYRISNSFFSVTSVKVFEKYEYNYLREIILCCVDYQEYKILEKDFKNLHPNDFEDLFLLNIQEKLNHLPKTDKTSLHTAVNMWIRNLVIRNHVWETYSSDEDVNQTNSTLERTKLDAPYYYFKEDYTIIPKPRRCLQRQNEQRKVDDGRMSYQIDIIVPLDQSTTPTLATQNLSKDSVQFLTEPTRYRMTFSLPRYLKDGDGDGNSQFLRCQMGSITRDEDYVWTMISRKLKITVKDKHTGINTEIVEWLQLSGSDSESGLDGFYALLLAVVDYHLGKPSIKGMRKSSTFFFVFSDWLCACFK